jgi:hypothetical protein
MIHIYNKLDYCHICIVIEIIKNYSKFYIK